MKGNRNATEYSDILDVSLISTFCQQFGEGPFLFQHDNANISLQKWFVDISVEELDLPAHSPDLNPIEHLLGSIGTLTASQAYSPTISA